MALGVDLSILNQRGTPAFFSDIFANRPAFGFAGRVFISTDTGAIYEDTGTAWTLIADAGAGTTGTLQQVTTNGNTTTQGISITAGGLTSNTIDLTPQGLSSTVSYIGQSMATDDNWKIYGFATTIDNGEMVFQVGDNAVPYGSGGQRFRFSYNASSSGTAKDVLLLDYNTTTFNTALIADSFTSSAFTTGSILFSSAAGLVSQDNANFFWDDTNNRLGIGTSAPSAKLDIHGAGAMATFNGTSTNNGYIAFQNAGVSKWLIGNTYSAGANNYNIYNNTLAANAITILNSNSNIGIGTINPLSKFVVSNAGAEGIELSGYSGYASILTYNRSTSAYIPLVVAENGSNLLVGTTTDIGYKLQVNGLIVSINDYISSRATSNSTQYGFVNLGDGNLYLGSVGVGAVGRFLMSTGVYTPTSDFNKKKDFEQSTIGLNAILALKPTLYRMKNENNTNKHLGFIAQEVKEFIPQAYNESKNFIGLDFNPIVATLVKAIQELNEKLVRNNIN